METEVLEKTVDAKKASLKLANLNAKVKNNALHAMTKAVEENRGRILEANKRDVESAEKLVREGKMSKAFLNRLKLSESKLDDVVKGLESVEKLDDPSGKTLSCTELDKGLVLYKVSCPIGLIGVIFESRPDVVPQVSALCLKSGNAVILKGGSEAKESNRTLFNVLRNASVAAGVPDGWMQLIETREEVNEILSLDEHIDLLIPRGSNRFVKFIQENTKIPVLGHSEGVCHVYVDEKAELNKAWNICFDAKTQYPAACNAMETLLVHKKIANTFLPKMAERYIKAGVKLKGCARTRSILKNRNIEEAVREDWGVEYGDMILSIKVVDSLEDAIEHVNTYSSGHTDAIVTENKKNARRFMEEVDSSSVMHNASTRFSDGFRYGLGAEVGISTNKTHARGPVGLEGLVIYKYLLEGSNHIVADYMGRHAKKYSHKKLRKTW